MQFLYFLASTNYKIWKVKLTEKCFLLNFICINIELQNNINRINANESTIPE